MSELEVLNQKTNWFGEMQRMIFACKHGIRILRIAIEAQIVCEGVDRKGRSICLAEVLTIPPLQLFHDFRGDINCLPIRTGFGICRGIFRNFEAGDSLVLTSFFSCFDLLEDLFYFFVSIEALQKHCMRAIDTVHRWIKLMYSSVSLLISTLITHWDYLFDLRLCFSQHFVAFMLCGGHCHFEI